MDLMLVSALVIFIAGCVIGYNVRAESAMVHPVSHGGDDLFRR